MHKALIPLFHFDRTALNPAKATIGLTIVLIALILLSTIGAIGFTMAFGVVLTIAFDPGGERKQRLPLLLTFGVSGALATLIGNSVGISELGSIVATVGVTFLCGLGIAFGARIGAMAFFINLWMMIMVSLSGVIHQPLYLALGFLLGNGAVALLLNSLAKPRSASPTTATSDSAVSWKLKQLTPHLKLHSPILHFAAGRALVAGFAMWLGWQLGLAHPYWIAMTILIVVVPDLRQAAHTSWFRAIGTIIGVAFASLLLFFHPAPVTLLLVWLLITMLMFVVQNASYLLYVSLLTVGLIVLYQLLEADVFFNGAERLFSSLLGVAMSLGLIWLLTKLAQLQATVGRQESHLK